MQFWQMMILAVVQGVTEFLPVSSSGHLVIVASLLKQDSSALDIAEVSIVLHVGTLLSIVAFYWRRIVSLLSEDRRVILLLIAGAIPAVVLGLPLKLLASHLLENTLLTGAMLIVTGWVLILATRFKSRHERQAAELQPAEMQAASTGAATSETQPLEAATQRYQQLSLWRCFLIGCSQAVAILPGLSRSGSTISTGMMLGLSPRSAATFSFLLAIPVIAGGGLLETVDLLRGEGGGTPVLYLLAGAAVSFLVGLVSLLWLVKWLENGRLQWFAWWCIPVGVAIIACHIIYR